MEKEMRELYVEGVAIHDGPESCAVVREGGGEALTGVRAGQAIEPRKNRVRGADAVYRSGRQHRWWREREPRADPVRSENLCMYGISMRENREIPPLPVPPITGRAAQGRLRP
jgi:RNA-directed DNA polymerase